jgi:hypothetical protein
MKNSVKLVILYDPPDALAPLRVGETTDPRAIREAARTAIAEAESRANGAVDPEVALDERAEAEYLRQALSVLVPGLSSAAA